jgi:hypothetical protein
MSRLPRALGVDVMRSDRRLKEESHLGRCARIVVAGAGVLASLSAPAVCQAVDGRSDAPAPRGGFTIGGISPPQPNFERCIDVEIGTDRAFGCLNQQLKREVDRVSPSLNTPPIDARSPDVRVGNVNEPAVRQQYGPNFGRSVHPFRPAPPVFAVPHR